MPKAVWLKTTCVAMITMTSTPVGCPPVTGASIWRRNAKCTEPSPPARGTEPDIITSPMRQCQAQIWIQKDSVVSPLPANLSHIHVPSDRSPTALTISRKLYICCKGWRSGTRMSVHPSPSPWVQQYQLWIPPVKPHLALSCLWRLDFFFFLL